MGSRLLVITALVANMWMSVNAVPSLNLAIIMDKSLSIGLDNAHCQEVSSKDCWPVAVDLAQQIVKVFEGQLPYGSTTENRGLCVSMMTVSCNKGAPVTKYLTYTGCSPNRDEVDGAIYRLGQLMGPHGGTCPSEAFDTTSRIIQRMHDVRPVSLVIYMTDTDVDETDSSEAKAAWKRLKETVGTTVKTYMIGRKWSAGETEKVLEELKNFDVQEEANKVSLGKNSGNSGSSNLNGDLGGLSTGAIAGISVGCVAAAVALYVVAKKRSDTYDLI